jgi:hypothetical protein
VKELTILRRAQDVLRGGDGAPVMDPSFAPAPAVAA